GEDIQIDKATITEETVFYTNPERLSPTQSDTPTKFAVIEADCIETSQLLEKSGYSVCMLNMANRQNPGGGVWSGAGAQEENLFRRSNMLLSLYQYIDYSNQYGIQQNTEHSYPLNRESGGIYTKDATIFRGSEKNGYCLLKNPFKLSVVSVPAINGPKIDLINRYYRITKELIEPSKEKIRTILRIGVLHHHDCLVLSAFGCGAFRNPPQHIAELFKEVFEEPEFVNQFKLVVFSIIDDHNAWRDHNPEGNVIPFKRVFSS
ncbi:MAG TPA: TIGR02452 family protein, partial [Dysgonamonadaceae bacterium]|nr:TIGR02452 family protein [Dysgonamonadaceae bacterium]